MPFSSSSSSTTTSSSLVERRLRRERGAEARVLSIQSHVVHGYAGNKCSVFPLQLHGFEVDFINSVQFSNHTGYKQGVRGYRLNERDLATLFEGLRLNNISRYSYVLSGYCGDASFLRQICSMIKEIKAHNPEMVYVCDPVLGDNDHYYVPEELCAIYRDEILPLADIITPNAFELSQLSGVDVQSEADCLVAIRRLHDADNGARIVVATSGIYPPDRHDIFYCFASEKLADGTLRQFRFEIPVVEGQYVGTGDVFTSLLIVWLHETDGNLESSVCNVIASLQALLKRTHAAAFSEANKSANGGDPPCAAERELKLVQSRYDFLVPQNTIKSVRL